MNGNNRIVMDCDRQLFFALAEMRLVDREQAALITGRQGVSVSTTNAWLSKLVKAGFLRRYFIATEKRGIKALYGLSPKSALITGRRFQPIQRPENSVLTSEPFILHQMAVNHIYVQLRFKIFSTPGISLIRWQSFQKVLSENSPIKPDGYFELETPEGIKSMFCEVDRGTESQKVWSKKVELYIRYAASGEFEIEFKNKQFRVLVIAQSQRRLEEIRKTVQAQTQKIFWFSTLSEINGEGLFASIWTRPEGSERFPLI